MEAVERFAMDLLGKVTYMEMTHSVDDLPHKTRIVGLGRPKRPIATIQMIDPQGGFRDAIVLRRSDVARFLIDSCRHPPRPRRGQRGQHSRRRRRRRRFEGEGEGTGRKGGSRAFWVTATVPVFASSICGSQDKPHTRLPVLGFETRLPPLPPTQVSIARALVVHFFLHEFNRIVT